MRLSDVRATYGFWPKRQGRGHGGCAVSRGAARSRRNLEGRQLEAVSVAHDNGLAARERGLLEPHGQGHFSNSGAGEESADEGNLWAIHPVNIIRLTCLRFNIIRLSCLIYTIYK